MNEEERKTGDGLADNSLLPDERMRLLMREGAPKIYAEGHPFPHVVVDDFFSARVLKRVLLEFPGETDRSWKRFHTSREIKITSSAEKDMGPVTRSLIHQLNSGTFLDFLSQLTGIEGLIPDPYLDGGGLHQILPGGKLGVHVDFDKHSRLGLDRRLNLLLYLNEDWREEFGGHFEMWDKDVTQCQRKVLPIFNRLVVFTTTDHSFHGHPEPLRCPAGRSRKSLALYYFTNGLREESGTKRRGTRFRARPGEKFSYSNSALLRSLVPPIIADLAQKTIALLRRP